MAGMSQSSVYRALLFACLFAAAGCGRADPAAGRELYVKQCSGCHGMEGEGYPQGGVRDLGSPDVQAKSGERLRRDIVDGVGKMPPTPGLSDQQAANLVAYVRTLRKS